MATNQVLYTIGTPIVIADTSYSPGTNTTLGTRTDQIECAGLTFGQARESDKIDLGMPHAGEFTVDITTEKEEDGVAQDRVDLYWAESHSVTTAVGNMGGLTGGDADYAGYAGLTLVESLKHLIPIGSFVMGVQNDTDGVLIGRAGVLRCVQQYGMLVYHWNTASVAAHVNSVEMAVRLTPRIPDIQAAA